MMREGSICVLPRLNGLGGPTSFQGRFIEGLRQRGLRAHHDPTDPSTRAVLVIAGTRHLEWLWQLRRRGVRIVQRLDGLNWVHRQRNTGLRHYLRSEWGNWLLATIRRYFADRVVYQSAFVRNWWQTRYGSVHVPTVVIHNGVDLNIFTPNGLERPPTDRVRILLVEGRFGGGNDLGLWTAARLTAILRQQLSLPLELMVAGEVPSTLKQSIEQTAGQAIAWAGVLPRSDIPALDRSAHLYFSAEINAPCPNSVIEALACGLPVLGFAIGALPELVQGDAGRLVPYGGNAWKLDPPSVEDLAQAAQELLSDPQHFRLAARTRAEAAFGLDRMVDLYLDALLG
jgi:glycosyltransferase involved in cell wall biosynthesis